MSLKVFDILGREVVTLVNNESVAGAYAVTLDGARLPSGMYIYQLKAGEFMETRKLVLQK